MVVRRAFGAGVLGAAVQSILMAIARSLGFPAKLELLLGSMFTASTDARAWVLGFVLHFSLGGVLGLVYALGFGRGLRRAGLGVGAAFGAAHALAAGVALVAVPRFHPLVPDVLVAPGPFLSNLGIMGVVVFVALHLVYGAIVGEFCRPMPAMQERFRTGGSFRR